MSTITSINIVLLVAFIFGCALVQADPIANPECKAADAPTAVVAVYAEVQAKIDGILKLVIDLCTQVKLNLGLSLLLSICIRIAANIKTISELYSGSCKQMKTTDIQGLYLSLKVSTQAMLTILGKCKAINVMVSATVDICIGLFAILDIYISLVLELLAVVNVDLSVYLQLCVELGLNIYANVFAQVIAVLQLCVRLSLGVSVDVNAILALVLSIAAYIKASIAIGIKVALGLCLSVSVISQPCKEIATTCGNQVTAIVNAIVSLTAGVTVDLTAVVEAILELVVKIKAVIKIKAAAIVTIVLTLSVQALSKACDCYEKAGSGMMKSPYKILQVIIKIKAAVAGLLNIFADVGLIL